MNEGCRSRFLLAAIAVAVGMASSIAGASEDGGANTFGEAVSGGDFKLAFRYRYEFVDQDGFDKDANASILRTRITYQSADFFDFSGLLEVDNLTVIGNDNYDSTRNGNTRYPTVADPKGTEVNQAILRFAGIPDTTLGYGCIGSTGTTSASSAAWAGARMSRPSTASR